MPAALNSQRVNSDLKAERFQKLVCDGLASFGAVELPGFHTGSSLGHLVLTDVRLVSYPIYKPILQGLRFTGRI